MTVIHGQHPVIVLYFQLGRDPIITVFPLSLHSRVLGTYPPVSVRTNDGRYPILSIFSSRINTRVTCTNPPVSIRANIWSLSRISLFSRSLYLLPFRIQYPRALAIPYFLRPVINPIHILFYAYHGSYTVFSCFSIFSVFTLRFYTCITRTYPPIPVRTYFRGFTCLSVFPGSLYPCIIFTYPPITIFSHVRSLTILTVLTFFPVVNRYRWMYMKIYLVPDLYPIFRHHCNISNVIITL